MDIQTKTAAREAAPLSADAICTHAKALGAPDDIAEQAAARIISGELVLLGVNGHLGSGKDTIAPAVLAAFGIDPDPDAGDARHEYYAVPLKREIDTVVLPALTVATDPFDASQRLMHDASIPPHQAQQIVARMWDHTRPGHRLHARVRTPEMRWLLQYWGTDVRRNQNDLYWVSKALLSALEGIADGKHVYVTDMRFPNEVEAARKLGFHTVRLDVSLDTQWERVLARDPDVDYDAFIASTRHASETALDDYDGFDQRLDNNGPLEPTVTAIVAAISARRTASS